MKNIIIIFAFIFSIVAFSSCEEMMGDYLDKPAGGSDITVDTVFSSKTYVDRYVTTLYKYGMHSIFSISDPLNASKYAITSSYCDEGVSEATFPDPRKWNAGTILASSGDKEDPRGANNTRWKTLRIAYNILAHIDQVPDADDIYKKRVKGDARFIIALNYFEMFKRYGGVPIINKMLDPYDLTFIKRSSVEDVVNFIVANCDSAATYLPNPNELTQTQVGHATKGAALMLKSRILLYAASPLFNTDKPYIDFGVNNNLICYGNFDKNRWKLAADAAKAVLDWAKTVNCQLAYDPSNPGNGTENYKYMWVKNDNEEIILTARHNKNLSVKDKPNCFMFPTTYTTGGWSGNMVTFNHVKKYRKRADGKPQVWGTSGNNLLQKYAELDPRFASTVAYQNSAWDQQYPVVSFVVGGKFLTGCVTGHWMHKFCPYTLSASNRSFMLHDIIFRLGEAYLNYAEALNEYYETPTVEAYDAVKAIRDRALMPPFDAGMTKEAFRAEIRNERDIELAFEDHRFWDIRRWKIAEDPNIMVMQGDVLGLVITKNAAPSNEFSYTVAKPLTRTFFTRMYLHPFVFGETLKGGGYLIQNPGY